MSARIGPAAIVVSLAACLSACHEEPPPNCWASRYPFESFPAPSDADPYLLACYPKGAVAGVGIRVDGTVVVLEGRNKGPYDLMVPLSERAPSSGAPRVVPSAELAARREQLAKLPAMPWKWDPTLQDELDCFGRTAPGSNTVVPLSAGARPMSAGAKSLVDWMNGLKPAT